MKESGCFSKMGCFIIVALIFWIFVSLVGGI